MKTSENVLPQLADKVPSGCIAFGCVLMVAVMVACQPEADSPVKNNSPFGYFEQRAPQTEWIDDRAMKLLTDFSYVDPEGNRWVASAGAIIDGSSIPSALWSAGYSPFVGWHRDASIIHDVACQERSRPWKEVHRAYYYACLCRGVPEKKAKLMYAAVYHFGPTWGEGSNLRKHLEQLASGLSEMSLREEILERLANGQVMVAPFYSAEPVGDLARSRPELERYSLLAVDAEEAPPAPTEAADTLRALAMAQDVESSDWVALRSAIDSQDMSLEAIEGYFDDDPQGNEAPASELPVTER